MKRAKRVIWALSYAAVAVAAYELLSLASPDAAIGFVAAMAGIAWWRASEAEELAEERADDRRKHTGDNVDRER